MKWSTSCKKYSDEELMILIRNEDNIYLRELYYRYSGRLLHFFYRMFGGDEGKAQDFLQEVFLKIIENSDHYKHEMKFSTWIFTIASNLCKNEYRRLKIRELTKSEPNMDLHGQSNSDDHIQKIHQSDFEKAIQLELQKMKPEQSSTFILRFQEGLTIEEIGAIMKCPPGTIKSRIFYVTKKLASRLHNFNPKF